MHRRPPRAPAKLELRGGDGEEREVHAPCAGYGGEGGASAVAAMGERER
jgi:hypothetical protein